MAAAEHEGVLAGTDGVTRCAWAGTAPDYQAYHDQEWGRTVSGDDALFERLCLEGFQSGLSWLTILRKREAFRRAFRDFRIAAVAEFDAQQVEQLLGDSSIVRNRAKIEATIGNARAALELDTGLSELLWSFAPAGQRARPESPQQLPASTADSTAMSKRLRAAGFRFVGPVTCYAAMQATGMVDDHMVGCWLATTAR